MILTLTPAPANELYLLLVGDKTTRTLKNELLERLKALCDADFKINFFYK